MRKIICTLGAGCKAIYGGRTWLQTVSSNVTSLTIVYTTFMVCVISLDGTLYLKFAKQQRMNFKDSLKSVQAELENSQNDNRALRERQEQSETNRIHLEHRLPTDEGESRVKVLMATFAAERQVNFSSRKYVVLKGVPFVTQ